MAQTPTISSVASSDISFDDLPAASDTNSQASEDDDAEPYDDPNLVVRDVVNIRVEKKLFWFPAIYLTEGSPYFAKLLETHDMSQSLFIRDADVSCLAFANLLQVLRTQLGVTPLSTLAEWTNVLHLSSKWGFTRLRTAAQQALLPLVSPVDKLVLARTYGFTEWISDAYVGLLEREDDLDEEEVERMKSKDIVAVAKGRRQAGKTNARSRAEIVRVVQSVLSPADAPVTSAPSAVSKPLVVQKKPKATVPTSTPLSDDAHTLVSRWVDQVTTVPSSGKACLSSYMKEDPSRVPLVLDLALQHAWKTFQSNVQLWFRSYGTSEYRPSWNDSGIGTWDEHLQDLQGQCHQLGLYHSHETISASLRFVDEWRAFRQLDLCKGINPIQASDEWQTLMNQTLFLGRFTIPNHRYNPPTNSVDASVHSTLWRAMTEFFTATPADPQRRIVVAQLLQAFLSMTRYCITRVECSWDTDIFYCVLEGALQETQDTTLRNLLQGIINSRMNPW